MAGRFREGELVEVSGMVEKVSSRQGISTGQFLEEARGVQAQLVRYDREASIWLAMSFSGQLMTVESRHLSPLQALPGVDFVLGPRSDESVLAQEMTQQLASKGYFVGQMMLSPDAVAKMDRLAQKDLKFTRVSAEFEPHYLGRDSREKVASIDFAAHGTPRSICDSPFMAQDLSMGSVCEMLKPLLKESLGIRVTGRSPLLVRKTFIDDTEEANFPPPETGSDRESMLNLIKRRRVCAMQFLGPLTGRLELFPRDPSKGSEIVIEALPGQMVVFLTETFQYSFTCSEGETTTLQTWFLSQQPQYVMGDYGGDLEVLGTIASGPAGPPGETVAVQGISTALGGDSKDHLCYWLMFNKAAVDTFVATPITR